MIKNFKIYRWRAREIFYGTRAIFLNYENKIQKYILKIMFIVSIKHKSYF